MASYWWVLYYVVIPLFVIFISAYMGFLFREERWQWHKFRRRKAVFLDKNGDFFGSCRIDPLNVVFDFKQRSFNYVADEQKVSILKLSGLIADTWYYFYDFDNPMPLRLKVLSEPVLNSALWNVQMRTKVAKDVNALATPSPFDFLKNPKVLFFLLAVGALIYGFATHWTFGIRK